MRTQTPTEERLNAITHFIGVVFGFFGLAFLLLKNTNKTPYSTISIWVYGVSIITLFTASTLYHIVTHPKYKHFYRVLDHVSIYLLIAGTYTPVCLIALIQSKGWELFYGVWAIALIGIILKLFYTGKFEVFSLLLYLFMGWLVVFDFTFLSKKMGSDGVLLLFAGGLAYTLGIVFYAIEKIPYNHVIWHVFVLAGAILHYGMIYFFVV